MKSLLAKPRVQALRRCTSLTRQQNRGLFPFKCWCRCLNTRQTQSSLLSDQSFESLGILPPIAQALYRAFPNVKNPTQSQTEFIPAILGERDILLKDATGTGKTFGTLLALLSKPRIRFRDPVTGEAQDRPSITSLVIVPHRDLAYQLLHWVRRMVEAGSTGTPPPMNFIAQALIRDITPISQLLSGIREVPPHVLIGTPQALLEAYGEDPEALQLETLSAVVVDEVDYLVESVPRKISQTMFEKARKKLSRHPSATKQLLDTIYADRIRANKALEDRDWGGNHEARRTMALRDAPSPQLIMSSATLRNHLKIHLYNESGWLKRDSLQKITGQLSPFAEDRSLDEREVSAEDGEDVSQAASIGGTRVEHCVLVVSKDGSAENIPGAIESRTADAEASSQTDNERGNEPDLTLSHGTDPGELPAYLTERMIKKFSTTPSPFNPNVFETVVSAFAMDVPSVALLVLPSTASVYRAVFELRMLGVNAHSLNLSDQEQGKRHLCEGSAEEGDGALEDPTLLVSTVSTTRGLDLPELSHLFILGNPEGLGFGGRVIDTYLHLAGRVGRFGRGGKVITVVEEREEDEGGKVVRDEPKIVSRLLKELKLSVTKYELFN